MGPTRQPPRCLTIAGSDSSAGAGIQADLKTFLAFDTYGMSAITAVTAQNTQGVRAIHAVPPDIIASQIEAILDDIGVDAVKTGMLPDAVTILAVARVLSRIEKMALVVDPVMIATSGAALIDPAATQCLQEKLFPLATVITPNLPEAETLTGIQISSRADMLRAAQSLLQQCPAVLLKGGHNLQTETCADLLVSREGLLHWMEFPRITTKNTHGTGCTLAAAVTSGLAVGLDLLTAVVRARRWLQGAIATSADWRVGHGFGPLDHGYDLRGNQTRR